MKNTQNKFEERRAEVEGEIRTPAFAEDLEHYDDGTWECSAASFELMAKSFKRYGFDLSLDWSFATLYERFCFLLRASSWVSCLDFGTPAERHSPEMLAYLRAVKSRDDKAIALTLKGIESQLPQLVPEVASVVHAAAEAVAPSPATTTRPKLYLVPG